MGPCGPEEEMLHMVTKTYSAEFRAVGRTVAVHQALSLLP
ncbi:hypothetical protein SHIRM173S_07400 [Streptomyces hirsutus]